MFCTHFLYWTSPSFHSLWLFTMPRLQSIHWFFLVFLLSSYLVFDNLFKIVIEYLYCNGLFVLFLFFFFVLAREFGARVAHCQPHWSFLAPLLCWSFSAGIAFDLFVIWQIAHFKWIWVVIDVGTGILMQANDLHLNTILHYPFPCCALLDRIL